MDLNSIPLYPLPGDFRWKVEVINPFTYRLFVYHPVLSRIPRGDKRWSGTVCSHFPTMEEQDSIDLMEHVGDMVFAKFKAEYDRFETMMRRGMIRVDLLRMKRTKVLTTKKTIFYDVLFGEDAIAGESPEAKDATTDTAGEENGTTTALPEAAPTGDFDEGRDA